MQSVSLSRTEGLEKYEMVPTRQQIHHYTGYD